MKKINWFKLGIIFVAFIVFSVVVAYFTQMAFASMHLTRHVSEYGYLAYLAIFLVSLVVNLSLVPLPFAVSLMIAAASTWNPILVALVGSVGASLGEMSYYYLGFVSKRVAIPDDIIGYQTVKSWVDKYGIWAIAFISFQPLIPIELGGLVAGLTKFPLGKFLVALWIGKFPKYLILVYIGMSLIRLMPFGR